LSNLNQLIKNNRINKKKKKKSPKLEGNPQRKGLCYKIAIVSPKKPNSAKRRIAKVLCNKKKKIIAYIPGIGTNTLQKHSTVLIRGGRVRDIPGMRYKLIRGKGDLAGLANRENARSKYGTKK
jgi:small subunit ribosomal protein S12